MEKKQSEWATSMPFKEQLVVIKRLFAYAKPFKMTFIIAIGFALVLATINVLMPRILQTLIDRYLTTQSANYFVFCDAIFIRDDFESCHLVLSMVFILQCVTPKLSTYSCQII